MPSKPEAFMGASRFFLALVAGFLLALPVKAQSLDDALSGVLRLKTFVPAEARTAQTLGREREGSAILIDASGLLLTVGYLMVEASGGEVHLPDGRAIPATIVGYDQDSGLGLMRMSEAPRGLKPLALGRSDSVKDRDEVAILAFGGRSAAAPAVVVSRRTFAGNWEYLLDTAIWTAPPHPAWSGAALVDGDARLVGVGSLIVNNAAGTSAPIPGNVFIPIDLLRPILGDLIVQGQSSDPVRPWLGMTLAEAEGRLVVLRVTPEGPAERAGIKRGDIVHAVKEARPSSLEEFYRAIWAQGAAGTVVDFELLQDGRVRQMNVPSIDRRNHLKLRSTL
jgi:S1-C subfamily serine protease